METIGQFIKSHRISAGYSTLGQLSRVTKVTVATLSRIEAGMQKPTPQTLEKIAPAIHCSYEELLIVAGYLQEDSMLARLTNYGHLTAASEQRSDIPATIEADEKRLLRVPILGSIRGGPPTGLEKQVEGYMYVDPVVTGVAEEGKVFYLRVKEDSMTPKYQPGDLVLILRQNSVENGEVAAVMIKGDEATLKKVYYQNGDAWLHTTNPNYEPIKVSLNDFMVLGKAISRWG